jgi:hypothetical protein
VADFPDNIEISANHRAISPMSQGGPVIVGMRPGDFFFRAGV